MRGRLVAAFVLAGGSLALAAAFGVLTAVCGGMEASPGGEARCVPAFHPWVPFWAGFALAGGVGFAFGRAWPAIALGAVGLAMGVLSGFSAGLWGIGAGGLLLAAGLVGHRGTPGG